VSDDRQSSPAIAVPETFGTGDLADRPDIAGLSRRFDRFAVDVGQRLDDILMLLKQDRADRLTERDRVDALERDMTSHRKYVDELGQRRKRAARK
jgi:hypothetical protein